MTHVGEPLREILKDRPFKVVPSAESPDPAELQRVVLGVGKIVLADDSVCNQAFRMAVAGSEPPEIKITPQDPSNSFNHPDFTM